jgi:pyridoxal phosphate enzyme, YggS family
MTLELNFFGENYPQELRDKNIQKIEKNLNFDWHFIGRLQKNKIKYVVGKADLIHSIDNFELIDSVQDYCKKHNIIQKVLIQINISNDSNKGGFLVKDLQSIVPKIEKKKCLRLCGFMTILEDDLQNNEIRDYYGEMYKIAQNYTFNDCVEISMGMSKDYPIALEEGSTIVRVGTEIFGPR